MEQHFDVLVVGGGPGGYTAALYCARAGFSVAVVEKLSPGGQMALAEQIDNYPGTDAVSGYALAEQMRRSAEKFGAKTLLQEAVSLELSAPVKSVFTSRERLTARAVILAMGAERKPLGLPREQELTGKGVHYCASCDGRQYQGKTVAVAGGGNTAAAEALLLSGLCQKVTLIHRRERLRAEQTAVSALEQAGNVRFALGVQVCSLLGQTHLTGVGLRDAQSGAEWELPCDGLFVCVGMRPASQLVQGILETDQNGYVLADETTRTTLPGVFAVGDLRAKTVRQIVTATADGAAAAHFATEYLHKNQQAAPQ